MSNFNFDFNFSRLDVEISQSYSAVTVYLMNSALVLIAMLLLDLSEPIFLDFNFSSFSFFI